MDQTVQYQDPDYLIIEDNEVTKPDNDSDSDSGFGSNTQVAIPNYWQSGSFRKNNKLMVHRIEEVTNDYMNVKRSFVNGMKNFEKHVEFVGIHRKNYEWSVIDEARVDAFRVFAAAVASRNGGDPNIKYGWYGGSREEIREILCHGFRRFENRSSSYGHGVYFSPANNPMARLVKISQLNQYLCILIISYLQFHVNLFRLCSFWASIFKFKPKL